MPIDPLVLAALETQRTMNDELLTMCLNASCELSALRRAFLTALKAAPSPALDAVGHMMRTVLDHVPPPLSSDKVATAMHAAWSELRAELMAEE